MTPENKDWTGNSRSAYAALGARNYAHDEREVNDYYATEPKAVRLLLEVETFSPFVWECACGGGHLARELEAAGYQVYATDLIDRGFGYQQDFLSASAPPIDCFDIITNPPYKLAKEFVEHALEISGKGRKIAMFLKIQFLEGKSRRELFKKYPPKTVYVSSDRLRCAMNGDFDKRAEHSAVCYAWYVWEKGYEGDTVLRWIN